MSLDLCRTTFTSFILVTLVCCFTFSGVARRHVVTCQGLLVRTLYYSFDGQLQIVLLPLRFGGDNTMFS